MKQERAEDSQTEDSEIRSRDGEHSEIIGVCASVDPCNDESFYVGRGKGNRSFAHLDDQSKMEKVARRAEIGKSGSEPK